MTKVKVRLFADVPEPYGKEKFTLKDVECSDPTKLLSEMKTKIEETFKLKGGEPK